MAITTLDCAEGISGAELVTKVNETITQVNDNTENKLDKDPNAWTVATIINTAFQNNINNVARYRLFQDKVELLGKIERNSTSFNGNDVNVFNVAAEFRPTSEKRILGLAFKNRPLNDGGNILVPAMIVIQTNGQVRISVNTGFELSGSTDFFHLDGLSYHLD